MSDSEFSLNRWCQQSLPATASVGEVTQDLKSLAEHLDSFSTLKPPDLAQLSSAMADRVSQVGLKGRLSCIGQDRSDNDLSLSQCEGLLHVLEQLGSQLKEKGVSAETTSQSLSSILSNEADLARALAVRLALEEGTDKTNYQLVHSLDSLLPKYEEQVGQLVDTHFLLATSIRLLLYLENFNTNPLTNVGMERMYRLSLSEFQDFPALMEPCHQVLIQAAGVQREDSENLSKLGNWQEAFPTQTQTLIKRVMLGHAKDLLATSFYGELESNDKVAELLEQCLNSKQGNMQAILSGPSAQKWEALTYALRNAVVLMGKEGQSAIDQACLWVNQDTSKQILVASVVKKALGAGLPESSLGRIIDCYLKAPKGRQGEFRVPFAGGVSLERYLEVAFSGEHNLSLINLNLWLPRNESLEDLLSDIPLESCRSHAKNYLVRKENWAQDPHYGNDQIHYGAQMHQSAATIAQKLQEKQWGFDACLAFAAAIRNRIADKASSSSSHAIEQFGVLRVVNKEREAYTLCDQSYKILADQIPLIQSENPSLMKKADTGDEKVHSGQFVSQIGDKSVELEGWRIGFGSPTLQHTRFTTVQEIMDHVKDLFNEVTAAKELDRKELTSSLGRIFWWICRAKPWVRGDPSIAEQIIRGVFLSKNMEAPAWKAGVIPWVDVILHPDVDEFAEKHFPSMFDED